MSTIRIECETGNEEYEFRTRPSIKKDDDFQKVLQRAKANGAPVKCLCQDCPSHEALLTIWKPANSTYNTLRRNPHYEHDETCMFYSALGDFYNEDNDCFSPSILKEAKALDKKPRNYELDSEREIARRYTYRHFCVDAVGEAQAYAFNKKNKYSESDIPEMYTTEEYFSGLHYILNKKKMSNGKSPFKSLPKNTFLSYGMIHNSLDEIVENKIILKEYKYNKNEFWNQRVNITDERLRITKNLQKIFGGVLSGPYVYIAIYSKDLNNQRKIIRIYTYAIQVFGDKFCFVESDLERAYALELLSNGTTFIKPVTGFEYKTIGYQYFPNGRPDLRFRPDFIEFYNNHIDVVEVCGFQNNAKYMNELERKEAHYMKLEEVGLLYYHRRIPKVK